MWPYKLFSQITRKSVTGISVSMSNITFLRDATGAQRDATRSQTAKDIILSQH
ncbi:MAG: hypothetical protein F6K21_05875 [Symploca sp. SIO2D2]|nr:hypothetical protein [Symploca sp. SIO2D2]